MTTSVTFDLATIISVICGLVTNFFVQQAISKKDKKAQSDAEIEKAKLLAEVEKQKAVEFALLSQAVKEMKIKFDKETGGNSGGLREAVNSTKDDVREIREMMVQHLESHGAKT